VSRLALNSVTFVRAYRNLAA